MGRPRAAFPTTKKYLAALLACVAMTVGGEAIAPAQDGAHDAQSAGRDLAHDADFRVRVQAALLLGKTRPEGARPMLEHALDDAHPAVRTAAAAALGALGDRAAVAALQSHARQESSGAVRAQIATSVATLSHPPGGDDGRARPSSSRATYVVELGQMRNATGVRGDELSNVLREAARAQAESLPGALVLDADDPRAAKAAARMPVLLLDGQLTRMSHVPASGQVRIEARVEFAVRRVPQQILKGTLSGGATAIESVHAMTADRIAELENQTVGSAVESAMRGADSGLALAAK